MAAYANEDRLELVFDIPEFYRRVGIVTPYTQLLALGLPVCDFSSGVYNDAVLPMVEFCAENPDYHMITILSGGRTINKFVPGERIYQLARGDKNPNLMLSVFGDPDRALVEEDMICAALAVLRDADDGDQ